MISYLCAAYNALSDDCSDRSMCGRTMKGSGNDVLLDKTFNAFILQIHPVIVYHPAHTFNVCYSALFLRSNPLRNRVAVS